MSGAGWILYIIFLVALMYFIAIRPQQKERKKMQALLASVAVGDSVLTSSGFYGVIIDMTDDTVIVDRTGRCSERVCRASGAGTGFQPGAAV